jgi:hypothetical protein
LSVFTGTRNCWISAREHPKFNGSLFHVISGADIFGFDTYPWVKAARRICIPLNDPHKAEREEVKHGRRSVADFEDEKHLFIQSRRLRCQCPYSAKPFSDFHAW